MQIHYFENEGGPVIGSANGKVIRRDGCVFRDLEGTGELLPYEDWRLDDKTRALDLASRLSVDEILGLMMYSPHQMIPAQSMGPGFSPSGTYGGKTFEDSSAKAYDLTDQQKDYLAKQHIRYILAVKFKDAATAALWNNELQAEAESLPHGIPVNISSDPRNGAADEGTEEFRKSGKDVSRWPEGFGIAATFSPELCREYASDISREYRALGITTALSPQADLATEPRWFRGADTFGTSPELVRDMVRAYCDGMQTTEGTDDGWGKDSVTAMVKHWPGGGPMEGGRDAHYPFGKYAVYPGHDAKDHLMPFLDGAFALEGGTGSAGAVMPYYSVGWDYAEESGADAAAEEWKKAHGADPSADCASGAKEKSCSGDAASRGKKESCSGAISPLAGDLPSDGKSLPNVGNSYSRYIIHDLLRGTFGFDGVVCTDWGITQDPGKDIDRLDSHCFGVEDRSEAERELLLIENGVDQFGGNSEIEPIREAYRIGVSKYGEAAMRRRIAASAARLLMSSFRCGLFENPYLDPDESAAVAGCREFVDAGFEAQKKSIVLLKNKEHTLPLSTGKTDDLRGEKTSGRGEKPASERKLRVYIPLRTVTPAKTFMRTPGGPSYTEDPAAGFDVSAYCERVGSPDEADAAIVFIDSPHSECYDPDDVKKSGNGYLPISLMYGRYNAPAGRKPSIAGGDFRENFTDRSFCGKDAIVYNRSDLTLLEETRAAMKDRKVILVVRAANPFVMSEVEPLSDAVLVHFGVSRKAVFDLLFGRGEPSGLLPVQMPASMETVERHCEDVPFDMEPYRDECGNVYDFGFGMNFDGPIHDGRAEKYIRKTFKSYEVYE